MQEKHNEEDSTLEPKRFSGILSGLKQLTINTEDMHRCHCIYGANLWHTVGPWVAQSLHSTCKTQLLVLVIWPEYNMPRPDLAHICLPAPSMLYLVHFEVAIAHKGVHRNKALP